MGASSPPLTRSRLTNSHVCSRLISSAALRPTTRTYRLHSPLIPAPPSTQNNDNETPLHCAAQYGHTGVVRLLLEELTDPTMRNNKFETPLDLAALYGRLEVVKLLLSAHPNLLNCNTKKHTPLHLASRNGHLPVVEVLLDAGMDINYEVRDRFHSVCSLQSSGANSWCEDALVSVLRCAFITVLRQSKLRKLPKINFFLNE